MKKLTSYQKEFIVNSFFRNEKYPGWRNVATQLVETGKCIVAGKESLWHGGIGNFIKVEHAEGTFGCSLLTFDMEMFLSSNWVKDIVKHELKNLFLKQQDIIKEHEEVYNLSTLFK